MRVAVDANTILSGLFFRGNERNLLLAALEGQVNLVFAEDVMDEVYDVVAETFRENAGLPEALDLLQLVFRTGELVPRATYEGLVSHWAQRLRDPTDAPVVACAVQARVEGLVSGDRDLVDLRVVGGIPVYRTRKLLEYLARED